MLRLPIDHALSADSVSARQHQRHLHFRIEEQTAEAALVGRLRQVRSPLLTISHVEQLPLVVERELPFIALCPQLGQERLLLRNQAACSLGRELRGRQLVDERWLHLLL